MLLAVFVEKRGGTWTSHPPKVLIDAERSGIEYPAMRKLLLEPGQKKFVAEYSYGISLSSPSVLLAGSYEDDFTIRTAEKTVSLPNSNYESGYYKTFPYKGGAIFDNHILIVSHNSSWTYYTDLDVTDINNIVITPLGSFGNSPFFYDAGDHKILTGINFNDANRPDYRAECVAIYQKPDGSIGSAPRLNMFSTGGTYISAGQVAENADIITCPFTQYTAAVKLDRVNHVLTFLGRLSTMVMPVTTCLSEPVPILATSGVDNKIILPNGAQYLPLSYPREASIVERLTDYTLVYRFPEKTLRWGIDGTEITLTEYRGGFTASVDQMSVYPQFIAGNSADVGERVRIKLTNRRTK
ncbi:Uncharacterised protein [uncultured Eubacterium sp.]|nr:Uncharacterised protein [uncultured Eubacterium sp.]